MAIPYFICIIIIIYKLLVISHLYNMADRLKLGGLVHELMCANIPNCTA